MRLLAAVRVWATVCAVGVAAQGAVRAEVDSAVGQQPARPAPAAPPQEKSAEQITAKEIAAAIGQLGSLDFPVRMNAARTIRRAPAALSVPALLQAVAEHQDGYVRFRALVLLPGFNDPRTRDVMARAVEDPNDRLRAVAYAFFEHQPDPASAPALLRALEREQSEFVRPALVRALAASGSDPKVRDTLLVEVGRGQDFFRSAVIEALGDYRAQYAVAAVIKIAELEGPLQDDAALALGKIGDKRALATLAALQRTAPRASQPSIAAAICLLGVNCVTHVRYLTDTVDFAIENPGFQDLLRNAAMGLAAIAASGSADAANVLFDAGIPSRDPARAPLALAAGAVAIRNTPLMLDLLEKRQDAPGAVALLGEAFDMLEEDFEEERFFVTVRRAYWKAPETSPARKTAELLIQQLEF